MTHQPQPPTPINARKALMGDNLAAQQALLRDEPDVLIATPSRLLAHLQAGNITLRESVQTLGAFWKITDTSMVLIKVKLYMNRSESHRLHLIHTPKQ